MADEEGFHVARAYVTVEPDTSDFDEELKARLEELHPEIRVRVVPDTEGFREEVQADLEDEDPVKVGVEPDADGFREKVDAELGEQEPVEVPVEPEAEDFEAKLQAAVDGSHATAEVGADLAPDAIEKVEAEARAGVDAADADKPEIEIGAKLDVVSLEKALTEARSELGWSDLGDSFTITNAGSGRFATQVGNDLEDAVDQGITQGVNRGFDDAGDEIASKAESSGSRAGGIFSHGWMANLAILGVAGAPVIGGMIGGALVTALAAAVIDKSPQLKASLESSLKSAESALEADALPAATALTDALKSSISQFDALGPEIRGVFQAATPDMTAFLSGLEQGVKEFLPGFTAGLRDMQPAMVAAESTMGELGKTLGDLFQGIEANGTGQNFANMLTSILRGVDNLIPGVSRLAGGITGALEPAIGALAPALGTVLGGIGSAVGAVARFNPLITDSAIAFLALRGPITSFVTSIRLAAEATGEFAVSETALQDAGMFSFIPATVSKLAGMRVALVDLTAGMEDASAAEKGMAVATAALDAVNPLAWVAAAAAAIGGVFYEANHMAASAVNDSAAALQKQMEAYGTNYDGMQKYLSGLKEMQQGQKEITGSLAGTNPFMVIYDFFANRDISGKVNQATASIRNFAGGLKTAEQGAHLTQAQVLQLGDTLGITGQQWTKSAASAHAAAEEIIHYQQAMEAASAGTHALAANEAVMTFATNQQTSAVTAVATAWTTYMSALTGTQSSFDTYALGMATLKKDADATGASFGGLSKNSLTLNQDFQSQLTSLQALSTSLRTSGVSSKVFDEGIQGGADTLVQFAAHNKQAQAELLAFSAQADGGITSFKSLTAWLGNTSDGAKKMQDAMDAATLAEAKVSEASKDLGSALQADVTNMMAQAELKTSGAQQKMTAYAQALQNAHTPASVLRADADAAYTALVHGGVGASTARQDIAAMGTAAGVSAGRLGNLGNSAAGAGSQMQTAAQKAYDLRTAIDDLHSKTVDVNVVIGESGKLPSGAGVTLPGSPSYASGGVHPGRDTGRDEYLVAVRGGEGMIIPPAVAALGGSSAIDAINRRYGGGGRNAPGHFASGGIAASAQFGFPQDVFNITVPVAVTDKQGNSVFSGFTQLANELKGFKTAGAKYSGESASSYDSYLAAIKKDNATRFTDMENDGKKLVAAFSEGTLTTVSAIKSEAASAEKTLQTYYSGPAATKLEGAITAQTASMEKLAAASTKVSATIAGMKAFSAQEVSSLQGFSGISNITGTTNATTGATAAPTGAQIESGLQKDLAQLRAFEGAIKELKDKKVATVLIEQVIQMGPPDGTTYAHAILSGGQALISQLNKTEKAITGEETVIGHTSAEIQYGQSISKGFLSGLDKEKAALDKKMQNLGDEIAKELAKALGVPVSELEKDEGIGKAKLTKEEPKPKTPVDTPPHIVYSPPGIDHPDTAKKTTTEVNQHVTITVNSPKGYFSAEQLAAIKHEISAALAVSH